MNRFYNRIALTLLAVLLLGGSVYAQFTTTFAKNASAGQQNGLYYSLPQTMLQLDFVVAETTFEEGPLSDYADTYFETSAYDSFEGTSYELLDVRMTLAFWRMAVSSFRACMRVFSYSSGTR